MQKEQRAVIKRRLDQFVEQLATDLELAPEAVADIAYLRIQKHRSWGRNPTRAQKRAAYEHWQGLCQACEQPVDFSDAVFHHVQRRIPNQHEPQNLLPYHDHCHDHHHGVTHRSLSKGAPRR